MRTSLVGRRACCSPAGVRGRLRHPGAARRAAAAARHHASCCSRSRATATSASPARTPAWPRCSASAGGCGSPCSGSARRSRPRSTPRRCSTITMRASVDALDADGGRASTPGRPARRRARRLRLRRRAGGRRAPRRERRTQPAEAMVDGAWALARPIGRRRRAAPASSASPAARAPFGDEERELLDHLCEQASVAAGHAERHAALRRQAVTDELTGLANHRRLQELLGAAVARHAAPRRARRADPARHRRLQGDQRPPRPPRPATACCSALGALPAQRLPRDRRARALRRRGARGRRRTATSRRRPRSPSGCARRSSGARSSTPEGDAAARSPRRAAWPRSAPASPTRRADRRRRRRALPRQGRGQELRPRGRAPRLRAVG